SILGLQGIARLAMSCRSNSKPRLNISNPVFLRHYFCSLDAVRAFRKNQPNTIPVWSGTFQNLYCTLTTQPVITMARDKT
ncbi:MAG: hypothetical protein WA656_13255, partial [Pseudolabrys sp.]